MLLAIAAMSGLSGTACAQPRNAALSARPEAVTATALAAGVTPLSHGALVYRPANAEGQRPLIVLLHGAGGNARDMLNVFREDADERGYLLLSLQSKEVTWDLIVSASQSRSRMADPRFGADVPRIDAVLRQVFAQASVDPRRVVLAGFSDGASYALSLGLANHELFGGILALSPGFMVPPDKIARGERVFIAHGRSDRVLAFSNAERIADILGRTDLAFRFRPFDGGHVMSRAATAEGMEFLLAR
jgi:predicted esterase